MMIIQSFDKKKDFKLKVSHVIFNIPHFIQSVLVYRDQEKVVGYEIVYKDAQNNTTTLKRIAPNFRSFGFKSYKEQKVLHYNEHLADIDVVHSQNEIEFIDILTSKGKHIKVFEEKLDDEDKCTSFNKIDISQKNYAPIIAFETTFSKDRLKELFVYRCPVRISKRRKQTNLTVNELNHLKAAPTLHTTLRAQQNISILRNLTFKEINKKKIINNWQNLANTTKSKVISSNTTLETPSIRLETLADQQKSREAFMEEQEYGVDDEDEEEKEDKKDKKSPPRKKSIFMFNPFGQRNRTSVSASGSPDKIKGKDDTFESQITKLKNTLFGKKTGSSSASTSRRASVAASLYKDPEKLAKFDEEYMQRKLERQKDLEKNEQMDFTLNKAKSPRDPDPQEVVQERSDSPKSPPRREKKSKTSAPVTPLQGWKKYSENVRSKLKAFAIFNEPNDNKAVDPDENLKTEQSPITYEMGDDDDDEVVVQSGGMNYRNKRAINFQSNSNSNSQSDSESDSGSGSSSSQSKSKSQSQSQSKSQSQSQSQSQSRQSHSRSQSRKQSHNEK